VARVQFIPCRCGSCRAEQLVPATTGHDDLEVEAFRCFRCGTVNTMPCAEGRRDADVLELMGGPITIDGRPG
jgi:hypothetical protein